MAKSKWEQADEWLEREIAKVRDEAFDLLRDTPFDDVYLWYKRGPANERALVASAEQPKGFDLAWQQRIPGNRDKLGLYSWIKEVARRLPIMPPELC